MIEIVACIFFCLFSYLYGYFRGFNTGYIKGQEHMHEKIKKLILYKIDEDINQK